MKYQILPGDNRQILKTFPDNYFDSIVTDPPYGIDFLGKAWDATTGALATYQECLRVLKPGGHILAFSAARTYHHLAVTIEQAGFEIRDQIMWIYSSGFPKSQDVGRQLHKKQHGRPDKQRFDKDEMEQHYSPGGGSNGFGRLAFSETQPAKNAQTTLWRHKENGKIYKALPDINGDRLAVSHEGAKYGTVYEEVIEVDNEWSGWGTALKPAHEPIVLARKPIKLSIAKNCQQWGVGALNIDAGRVPWGEDDDPEAYVAWMKKYPASTGNKAVFDNAHAAAKGVEYVNDQAAEINPNRDVDNRMAGRFPSNVVGEIAEPYQKYFYCPKVGRAERHVGCVDPGPMFERPRDENGKPVGEGESMWMDPKVSGPKKIAEQPAGTNNHPTVKPIELMKYLIKLVTPAGGHVLDPFNGSGSTGCAAVELDMDYTGIELDPAYVSIARQRIEAWQSQCKSGTTFEELFE